MYSKYRSAFSFSHTILCMLKKYACDIWNYCQGMSSAPWQEEECIWISARNGCWATLILKKVAYGIDHSQSSCECMMWIGSSFATEWEACFFRYLSYLISWHLNCFFLPAFHENPFNFVAISYIAICYLCYNLLRRVIICLECGIHHTPSPIPSSIPFNFISFLFLVLTQTQRIWNFAPSN